MRKEIDLRSTILESLKKEGIIQSPETWDSQKPYLLLPGQGILLIAAQDKPASQKKAYEQAFRSEGSDADPKNRNFLALITPSRILVYRKGQEGTYLPWDDPHHQFAYPREWAHFLVFLRHPGQKVLMDPFFDDVLSSIYCNPLGDPLPILLFLLHMHETVQFFDEGLIIAPHTPREQVVVCNADTQGTIRNLQKTYQIQDVQKLQKTLREQGSHYQPDAQKSSLGKYYTPYHLVNLVKEASRSFRKAFPRGHVLDSCAGCGAFLEAFREHPIIGRDIDPTAVRILQALGYPHVKQDNSLQNSQREKYHLSPDDPLLIVGNPPYNDITSRNKRYGAHQKIKQDWEIDPPIRSKDYGMAFLKHYASLSPDEMILLHPLSYLHKKANFTQLKDLFSRYTLVQGTIFSSEEFGKSLKAHKTPFPIVCAHYQKGQMTYADIRQFPFPIFGSSKNFVLDQFYTIDEYGIRKYPPTQQMEKISDIGLYHYNIRDANSLKTAGNIVDVYHAHAIPIQFQNLYAYAYLNAYRRYARYPYYLGNISPLCDPDLLDNPEFRDFLIMDLIIHNQRLAPLDIKNPESFLHQRQVLHNLQQKRTQHPLYESFALYLDNQLPIDTLKSIFAQSLNAFFVRIIKDQQLR